MTRDIKFRLYNRDTKNFYTRILNNAENVVEMQYTGIKDKNGKEIYEFDVVKNNWSDVCGNDIGGTYIVRFGLCEGPWEDSLDFLGWYGERCLSDSPYHRIGDTESLILPHDSGETGLEVIGNIFENPEYVQRTKKEI